MTNRIHIDAPTGVIEVEGEKDFVEAQLDKLMPLIQACGFGTLPARTQEQVPAGEGQGGGSQDGTADTGEDAPPTVNGAGKKSRRGKTRAPKGQSCADRILILRGKGFFKTKKLNNEIVDGLAKEGWIYKTNQVAAATGPMFDRGDLQRTAEGKAFAYFWDRD